MRQLSHEVLVDLWAFVDDGRPVDMNVGGRIHSRLGEPAVFLPSRRRPGVERHVEVRSFLRRDYTQTRANGSIARWTILVPA